jgi:hypothetical protein
MYIVQNKKKRVANLVMVINPFYVGKTFFGDLRQRLMIAEFAFVKYRVNYTCKKVL